MKKVLSLVLAFAMILGSFGFVFANQYPDVKDTEYYSESVNVLSGLGVVGGFPDGTFQPDGKVTRAQMAVMLINSLGIPVSGKADTPFSDVPASHWASGYIKYAANMGYVAGYADGTFKPDKEVSYDEALTMIVAALGYTSEGLTGTWPGNFVNAARGLGLLNICKKTGSAAASRADVCCYLYKALTCPIGRTNKDGEFVPSTPLDTMIDRLGAEDYNGGNPFVVTGNEDSTINLGEYLGAYITAYANEDGDIIAIKEVKSEFIEKTAKKIQDTYTKTDASVWTDPVDFFKNGEDDGTKSLSGITPQSTTVKVAVSLANSKKIDEIYSIQVWELTDADFASEDVQEIINEDHKLINQSFEEDDDEEIDMNSFVLLGRDSLADIAENDVVYVYVGPNSGKITKIEIGTEVVEGKISKMPSNKDQVTVGGKTYDLSASAINDGKDVELYQHMLDKKSCTFYLDYAGDVYDYELDKDATSDAYGILLNGWEETVKGKTTPYVELFMADGKSAEFECAWDDNGTPNDKSDDYPIYDNCYIGALVKFTTNSKNVVTELDDSTVYPFSDLEVSKNGVAGARKISSSTVAFEFSGDISDPDEMGDAGNYKVVSASTLFGTTLELGLAYVDGANIEALITTGAAGTESAELAFVVEEGDKTPDGKLYTVLYEGKSQELNFEDGVTVVVDAFYTLTVNDDGLVTAAKLKNFDAAHTYDVDVSDPDGSVTYSGNIFTDADKNSIDMDPDIVVYVKNSDDEWSYGTKSALKGKNTKYDSIKFLKTGDGDYDIVIVDQF